MSYDTVECDISLEFDCKLSSMSTVNGGSVQNYHLIGQKSYRFCQ